MLETITNQVWENWFFKILKWTTTFCNVIDGRKIAICSIRIIRCYTESTITSVKITSSQVFIILHKETKRICVKWGSIRFCRCLITRDHPPYTTTILSIISIWSIDWATIICPTNNWRVILRSYFLSI